MNKKKTIPVCLATLIALPTLSGCANQDDATIQTNDQQDSDNLTSISNVQETYLAVEQNKCIGCGKCVKFDPEHFIMNTATKKSTVISQSNLESTNLKSAISRCPVNAITL